MKKNENIEKDKLLPNSEDLEQVVLGAIIYDSRCLINVIDFLKPELFYAEAHQKICKAVLDLYAENSSIDLLLVTEKVKNNGDLKSVGGAFYITQITSRVASSVNVVHHLRIIYQKYLLRELIHICSNIKDNAFMDTTDVFDLLDDIKKQIERIDVKRNNAITISIEKSIDKTIQNINAVLIGNLKTVFKTGNQVFDDIVGLSKGECILIAGKSGAGKTSFGINMVKNLFDNNSDLSVLWYSMEDSNDKIIRGFLSQETLLDDEELQGKKGKINNSLIQVISDITQNKIRHWDIEFVTKRSKIKNIRTHFSQFVNKRPDRFCLLIIDNIMKLQDYDQWNETECQNRIGDVIGDIYDEHKENHSILYFHHLAKESFVKERLKEGYRPQESDIRGSSILKDVATVVMLVNRPANFSDMLREYKSSDMYDILKRLFIIEVTKHRNGKTGIIRQFCHLGYKIFKDIL